MAKHSRLLILAAAAAAVLIAGLGTQDLWASRGTPATPAGAPALAAGTADPEVDACLDGEVVAGGGLDAAARPGGGKCANCPQQSGSCTRVSCNPCCYNCPGVPYLVCIEQ